MSNRTVSRLFLGLVLLGSTIAADGCSKDPPATEKKDGSGDASKDKSSDTVDFTGIARSAGYASCHDFSELSSFEQQVGHVLGETGPVFATLHVERTRPLTYDYPALYAPEKRRAIKAELAKG